MKDTYVTVFGDTFEKVSRKVYGDESFSNEISLANPGYVDPLFANSILKIPQLPLRSLRVDTGEDSTFNPLSVTTVSADSPNEVALLIGEIRFRHFDTVTITRVIDSFSTVKFTAPFEPDDENFRKLFVPLSFTIMNLYVGGKRLFLGRIVDVSPKLDADKRVVEITCYSFPAILNDVSRAPGGKTDFIRPDLLDITFELVKPHGIQVFGLNDEEFKTTFENVSIKPKEKIIKFLSTLAEQRRVIITDDENGALIYYRVIETGEPVARLKEGISPLVGCSLKVKSQNWFSDITGLRARGSLSTPTEDGYTAKNNLLPNVFRPFTFRVQDNSGPVKEATESKLARMMADVITCECELTTWRDPQGNLFRPNTFITVHAPSAMIYNEYKFIIAQVRFTLTAEKETCHLSLVLPGSFTGQAPENLPWAS